MDVVWQATGYPGLEFLRLSEEGSRVRAEGTVIAVEQAAPYQLRYTLDITRDWHIRAAHFQLAGGRSLQLQADADGQWTDGEGQTLRALAGCDSLDITATPFTNTLPVQALRLAVGQSGVTRAAWVQIPGLDVQPSEQRYSRLDAGRYRFELLGSDFQAELLVDEHGLVVDYPGLFRRLA